MTQIPPTTAYEIDAPDASPCCAAPLTLVSPPLGYECRECMAEYTLPVSDGDDEVCGAELSSGGTCDRLAAECPYHG